MKYYFGLKLSFKIKRIKLQTTNWELSENRPIANIDTFDSIIISVNITENGIESVPVQF